MLKKESANPTEFFFHCFVSYVLFPKNNKKEGKNLNKTKLLWQLFTILTFLSFCLAFFFPQKVTKRQTKRLFFSALFVTQHSIFNLRFGFISQNNKIKPFSACFLSVPEQ
jgi:hypothetical protein